MQGAIGLSLKGLVEGGELCLRLRRVLLEPQRYDYYALLYEKVLIAIKGLESDIYTVSCDEYMPYISVSLYHIT